jgi:hypothetical protein
MILSLTSAANMCQQATSSRRPKSVQAACRQGGGASPQLSCCIMLCGFRDAGAIPAASNFCIINICIIKTYDLCGRGSVSRRTRFLECRSRRRERRKMHGYSSLYRFRSRCLYRQERLETPSDVRSAAILQDAKQNRAFQFFSTERPQEELTNQPDPRSPATREAVRLVVGPTWSERDQRDGALGEFEGGGTASV